MRLTPAQLATVLAALRWWQMDLKRPNFDPEDEMPDHFYGVDPLTSAEIDELCEELNCDGEGEVNEACCA